MDENDVVFWFLLIGFMLFAIVGYTTSNLRSLIMATWLLITLWAVIICVRLRKHKK